MSRVLLSPTLLCMDFSEFKETLSAFEKKGIEALHIDVMDGEFVPNYALGTDLIRQIRKNCSIPLDIHLMVIDPEKKLDYFNFEPDDYVSVHVESTEDIKPTLQKIRLLGAHPLLAISPDTPVDVIRNYLDLVEGILVMTVYPGFAGQPMIPNAYERIKAVREILNETGYSDYIVEVDGHVGFDIAVEMQKNGADMFVGGTSSIFWKGASLEENVDLMREKLSGSAE